MKLFLFLLFFMVNIFASEIGTKVYTGFFTIDHSDGNFYGTVFKNSSEDETLSFQLGVKYIAIEDMNYRQNETFISLQRELTYESRIQFSYFNIGQKSYGGNLYSLAYKRDLDSGMDLNVGVGFLNYDLHNAYQLNASLKGFIGASIFYYKGECTSVMVNEIDKNYNSIDLELGFVYAKYEGMLSSFLGEKRYTLQDENLFSWNMGNLHKSGLRAEFGYQFNTAGFIGVNYLYSKMQMLHKRRSDLNVFNVIASYRF